MSNHLLNLSVGLRNPVPDAQACFRVLLEAMSRPGRIVSLPEAAMCTLVCPPTGAGQRPMGAGTALLLLTLLDAETSVYLHGSLDDDALRAWLRFHTGVGESTGHSGPAFTVARAEEFGPSLWGVLELGTDEAPQLGTTLIMEVGGLSDSAPLASDQGHCALRLSGPGIADRQVLQVLGSDADLWRYRITLQPAYPRGFDMILVCGNRVAALPRSTRVQLEH